FQGESAAEILEKVQHDEPLSPRSVNARVDGDLETICLKCLAKEPARRYSTALALTEDLERWTRGEPILARPVTLAERTIKWARRQRVTVGLGSALVALVLIGVA